jgi:pimeloyl-ACP methyl ester carboxylesterase
MPNDAPIPSHAPMPDTVLPRHVVDLYGTKMAFVDVGRGDPVVLLHGITCSAASWNRLVPALAKHHRVIVPDLPGHGLSSRARGDYSVASLALHVRDLLMGLGVARATFVGHSLGGGVTMQTAYAYPELVSRMVLVASGGLGESVGLALRAATLPGVEWLLPLAFNRFGARVTRQLGRHLTDPRMVTFQELAYSYAMLADPAARRAFVSLIRSVIDWNGQRIDATRRLHLAEDVPMMVVWGDADVILPIGHGIRAARDLPVDRFEVFEGAGHFPHLEQADRFLEVFDEFLRESPPAANSHRHLAEQIRMAMHASDPAVRLPTKATPGVA